MLHFTHTSNTVNKITTDEDEEYLHVEFLAMGNSGKNNQKNPTSQQRKRHQTLVFLFAWPESQVAVAHKWAQLSLRWWMMFTLLSLY